MSKVDNIISGFKWITGARLIGQLFNWMVTIVVIRLLEPEDYGVFAVALVVTTFMSMMSEFGVGDGLVRKNEFGEGTLRKTFGFILIVNTTLFLLLYLGAPYVSEFYEKQQLTDILQVQAYKFLIISLFVICGAKMRHKMRFKRLSINAFVSGIGGGVITLILALNGFGVWSLVWGNLGRIVILGVLAQVAEPTFLVPNFDIRDLNGVGSFGFLVLLSRLSFFFYTKADILLMSKILNTDLVGFYTVAKDLATLPMAKIASSINTVGFPAFSKFEDKRRELTGHYLKAITSLGFISFPVFFGISSIAPEVVPIALGEKWGPSILLLQVLALSVPFRVMNLIHSTLHQGAGSAFVLLKNNIVAMFLYVPLFIFSLRWGALGAAYVWAIVTPVYFLYVVSTIKPYVQVTVLKVVKQLAWPFFASLAMFMAVRAVSAFLGEYPFQAFIVLFLEILIGVIVYCGILMIFDRRQISAFFGLLSRRKE